MTSKELVRKGEGENYNYSQDHCFIKLSSRQTNGELCLIEDTLKPGSVQKTKSSGNDTYRAAH